VNNALLALAFLAFMVASPRKDQERTKPAADNLVVNGSFEEGPAVHGDGDEVPADFGYLRLDVGSSEIRGWVVSRGQIDLTSTHWKAADGTRSIDLNGSPGVGGIRQRIHTEAGKRYKLTFKLAGHPVPIEDLEPVKTLRVTIGGDVKTYTFDTTGKSRADMGWREETFVFTARRGEAMIEFDSLSDADRYGGPAIDDVRVVELPGVTP
jgi:choice-of-anchor C domain-containing protein